MKRIALLGIKMNSTVMKTEQSCLLALLWRVRAADNDRKAAVKRNPSAIIFVLFECVV